MKKTILIFFIILIPSEVVFPQSGWIPQNSGTNSNLTSIFIVDDNIGFVGGYNVLLKTTNGGLNWVQISFCSFNGNVNSISFVDENTGFISAGNLSTTIAAIFAKTTNSGLNWECTALPIEHNYLQLTFFDANNGYGVYTDPILEHVYEQFHKTTNSGLNWNILISHDDFINMFFLNNNTGYLSTDYYGWIRKTTNGGNNWTNYCVDTTNNYGQSIMNFINDTIGFTDPSYIFSFYIMKTTTGGMNWFRINNGLNRNFTGGFFLNELTGYSICTYSDIFKTTNGGVNWINQYSGNVLNKLYILNINTGYVIGENGLILKTTNGGNPIGINLISNEVPKNFTLYQNYPNPFNPSTKIKFDVPKLSFSKLIIYDLLGREIATLVNEELKPGTYEAEWNGRNFANGIYFYMLVAGDYVETKKMVLMK